jgi:hypothetical protein
MERVYGAMPPPGKEWTIGKTAGAISFVGDAEAILAESKLSSETAQRLRDWVERVKAGEPLDADHFLTRQEIVARCI